jgi:hypothetical protein
MLRGVRAQAFEILCMHRISLLDQLPDDSSLVGDRLKHHGVGDELIVMDCLLVFRGIVAPQDALAAEQNPLREPVKRLDLVLGEVGSRRGSCGLLRSEVREPVRDKWLALLRRCSRA